MNLKTYMQHHRLGVMKANILKARVSHGASVNLHQRSVEIQEEMLRNQEHLMLQAGSLGQNQNVELKRIADALDRIQAPVTAGDL